MSAVSVHAALAWPFTSRIFVWLTPHLRVPTGPCLHSNNWLEGKKGTQHYKISVLCPAGDRNVLFENERWGQNKPSTIITSQFLTSLGEAQNSLCGFTVEASCVPVVRLDKGAWPILVLYFSVHFVSRRISDKGNIQLNIRDPLFTSLFDWAMDQPEDSCTRRWTLSLMNGTEAPETRYTALRLVSRD